MIGCSRENHSFVRRAFFLKSLSLALLILCSVLLQSRQASAALCALDDTPAATLLVLYFEVDVTRQACERGKGVSTKLYVTNTSASAVLAHVVIWTAWSVPALDLDVYIMGYGVQEINLGDILRTGEIPGTAPLSKASRQTGKINYSAHWQWR